ncbi:MAG: orotidine-5'-phosphate decarboxylase [Candidatus Kerfeldbacteria bacterium]|nr:orotidine-5'-phosphate decarboxylase [Candidatus Kerfeldbacteria bacterium]
MDAYENAKERCFVALDFMPSLKVAMKLTRQLASLAQGVKAHGLVDRYGALTVVPALKAAGATHVFLDLKLHDTEGTVGEERAAIAREAGAHWLSVHISGGEKMMMAANKFGPPNIIGITVLTSISPEECVETYGAPPNVKVPQLARKAQRAGLDALVCSAKEVAQLKAMTELAEMDLIVPGTRSTGQALGGQVRVDTPENALIAGADFLVAGRQVTQAADPVGALEQFLLEMARGIETRGV